MGGGGKAQRPPKPAQAIPPVTEEDENVQLAAQYEEDRLRRSSGSMQNRLINPAQRSSSGNLLLSQTSRQ
jgi:hypothetical protein